MDELLVDGPSSSFEISPKLEPVFHLTIDGQPFSLMEGEADGDMVGLSKPVDQVLLWVASSF
jgi:hypothetical protein